MEMEFQFCLSKQPSCTAGAETLAGLGTIGHLLPVRFLQDHAELSSDLLLPEDTSSVLCFSMSDFSWLVGLVKIQRIVMLKERCLSHSDFLLNES